MGAVRYFTIYILTNLKLAAIYNVWDGDELLKGSIGCIKDHVDLVIIVWQEVSNFGEQYSPILTIQEATAGINVILEKYIPTGQGGFNNETQKRNIGLRIAKEAGCTHFLFLDCDEYYKDFAAAKSQYISSGAQGSVCHLFTYFKNPALRFEKEDNYFVPFIHQLTGNTIAGRGKYPYYVDPTRKVNCSDVALIQERMHHFSYVRLDIERKCRNSSARANIEKSRLLRDYYDPAVGPGFYVEDFKQRLVEVSNQFLVGF